MTPIKHLTRYFLQEQAANISHSGGSYLAHAVGVYRDLKSWGWDEETARAGLFHSIYGTEFFQGFTLPISKRNEISSMIGDHAETLCYLNCALKRRPFDVQIRRRNGPRTIEDRFSKTIVEVSDETFDRLCEMHLCDWLEQVRRAGGWDYRRGGYRDIARHLGGTALEKYDIVFKDAPEQIWFNEYHWPEGVSR